jgi:hypothetical protein
MEARRNMVIATMHVKLGLSSARDAINGYIRDGIIYRASHAGFPGDTAALEMREQKSLENKSRSVWVVGKSAIVAEYRTETLTEIKLLPVKGVLYHDGIASRDWRLIEDVFNKTGLISSSESTSRDGTGDIATVLHERRLIQNPRPRLESEKMFKVKRRKFYDAILVVNKGLPSQYDRTDEERVRNVSLFLGHAHILFYASVRHQPSTRE